MMFLSAFKDSVHKTWYNTYQIITVSLIEKVNNIDYFKPHNMSGYGMY